MNDTSTKKRRRRRRCMQVPPRQVHSLICSTITTTTTPTPPHHHHHGPMGRILHNHNNMRRRSPLLQQCESRHWWHVFDFSQLEVTEYFGQEKQLFSFPKFDRIVIGPVLGNDPTLHRPHILGLCLGHIMGKRQGL